MRTRLLVLAAALPLLCDVPAAVAAATGSATSAARHLMACFQF